MTFERTASNRVDRRREYEADLIRREKQDLADTIAELKDDGSSLIMNYGEDTGCWEVAFITKRPRVLGLAPCHPEYASQATKGNRESTGSL